MPILLYESECLSGDPGNLFWTQLAVKRHDKDCLTLRSC
jgi:hypothetical protein